MSLPRKKILYFTVPSFFDLEISLIRELSSFADVEVILLVTPKSMHSSAFSMESLSQKPSLKSFSEIDGLDKYSEVIDLSQWSAAILPSYSLPNLLKLRRLLKKRVSKGNYDIFHCATVGNLQRSLLGCFKKIPKRIMNVHDPIPHRPSGFFRHHILRSSFHWGGNLLLFNTCQTSEFTKLYGLNKQTIHFSRLAAYDFINHFPTTPNPYGKYILFFGRIEPYKGVEILTEAFLNSQTAKKGIKLIIAGKGNLPKNASSDNPAIITLNRYIGNDELANLIRHSMFVVIPYLTATQSGVLMSVLALGKPSLVSDAGDLPNAITASDGTPFGLVAKAGDPSELASQIDRLCADPALCETLSNNIRKALDVDSKLSWKAVAAQIYTIYNLL